MSSAAVQQQQTTPQHYQQFSPSQQDRYGPDSTTSPASRRGGPGNASLSNTPQQVSYTSPASDSTVMASPRSHASPSQPLSQSTYQQFYPDGGASMSGPAAALPIRTSSQQAPTTPATASYGSPSYSSRSQQPGSGYDAERTAETGRRQAAQRSPNAEPASTSRSSQRSRNAPMQSRSATAVGQPPVDTSLPRENSAIINHIVVDDPQADLARERARIAESRPHQSGSEPPLMDQAPPIGNEQRRSRQEHLKQPAHRKEVKFGDYILGQTLGEGEFGKVKMGWKKDSSVQVAIKLIKKESLQGNATRLPKIYREIGILRDLQHPNIVRLHEFVETERHMGIILEYASGGELFDYILNHRYLKDPAARRLFAQLVSGVGYLHKKGIVHRDLKLENLLLDRNKNIIITDFGFANTFNPHDELPEEVEAHIQDKDFVKREGLDKVNDKGMRRGDLMQTSCGSPCYAAPELVVSDGLYTGRKVDVWSCGVILYAMLAGYLPFDDDPANPEGDNINLLYKYIVSTPLTFPEYVTPHARDLLRRILVPQPEKRADLFEVARHSWLSEYSHVVGFIGSSTKSDRDIATSAMQQSDDSILGRSTSVRDTRRSPASAGGIVQKQPPAEAEAESRSKQRDAKRRTVQLEYVPPRDSTARGEASPTAAAYPAPIVPAGTGRTRARAGSQGPVEVPQSSVRDVAPQVPRKDVPSSSSQAMPPPTRPGRDQTRAASDSPAAFSNQGSMPMSRPTTGGSLGGGRLPSRGNSYSQPAIPAATNMNAQGHFSQPKSSSGYIISSPNQQNEQVPSDSRQPSMQNLAQYQNQYQQQQLQERGHKRSSTLGSIGDRILGRSSSRRGSQQHDSPQPNVLEKRDRKYPPVSMRNAMPNSNEEAAPRQSSESSRRTSFGFSRKNSEVPSSSNESKRSSRRFSFLPNSFSMNSFGGGSGKKEGQYDGRPASKGFGSPSGPTPAFGQGKSRSPSMSTTNSTIPLYYEADREAARTQRRSNAPISSSNRGYDKPLPQPAAYGSPTPPPVKRKQYRDDGYGGNLLEPQAAPPSQQDPVERYYTPNEDLNQPNNRQQDYAGADGYPQDQSFPPAPTSIDNTSAPPPTSSSYRTDQPSYSANAFSRTEALPQQNMRPERRKFEYDQGGHGGSSSATRRVMDFFRRRGREREG